MKVDESAVQLGGAANDVLHRAGGEVRGRCRLDVARVKIELHPLAVREGSVPPAESVGEVTEPPGALVGICAAKVVPTGVVGARAGVENRPAPTCSW